MQEYGEQIAAASDGRIKVLWRKRGAGGPKSGGPYKVGLIILRVPTRPSCSSASRRAREHGEF